VWLLLLSVKCSSAQAPVCKTYEFFDYFERQLDVESPSIDDVEEIESITCSEQLVAIFVVP
jgi:hypothetical protein